MRFPFVPIRAVAVIASAALSRSVADAQGADALTRPYTEQECPSCATWNAPQSPVKIHGDTYYVGTRGLTAILITSPDGHLLIDGGLPNSAPLILDNIRALGFKVEDIRLILNSHVHFDHAGGVAALQRASGARVAASEPSARVLEHGRSVEGDPQHGELLDFPAVLNVSRFAGGDTLRVGRIAVTAHLTAGHTPGGTTWTWRSCDAAGCLDLVYADSQTPISAERFRFSDSPAAIAGFQRGFAALERLSCDILVTPHPGASALWERLEKGPAGLIERDACRKYAATARQQLERRLETERGSR